ncbi:hypothetical protein SUGI_0698590 [Cryptomeria japonica]|nr:hypothetical protein SUGI_0698590 [Cryptomeria japonica]
MRSASLHVAIFSPNYAQSPWCLAELSFMLKTGKTLIPVFYHVQPSDLRWVVSGKGMYSDAFSEHEKKGRYGKDKLEEWKMALHNVSFYNGPIMNNDDDEGRLLKNIVNGVLKAIKKVPLDVAKHPVGLTETVQDFEITALESAQNQNNVQIVGIWGMGGAAKTTLAKEIYNRKCSCMQRASFLFDVRDASAKNEMTKKQKTLLKDLGINHVPDFDSIEKGKGILASCLSSMCVLIILDDVDHIDQLEALLPTKDNLGWGSLIIVTTRERELLRCWGVSSIYEMRTLNHYHAKQLFCWHAFLQPSPTYGFEELVAKFLSACDGLPLSLKVIGGLLYGESRKDYWHDLLHKISKILPSDIKNRLRVSYDALDEEEKQIFLDTACFFIGEDKKTAIAVWDGFGWNGRHSWERLMSKCLVDVNENNHIKMHDHLRDLGREIAITQPPYRLWSSGQITDIQKQKEERIQIRGMILDAPYDDAHEYLHFLETTRIGFPGFCWCFRRQPFPLGLKVFVVRGNSLNKQTAKLSKELVWLRWSEIAHKSLPSWLPLKKLSVLELINSKHLQELWKHGVDAPVQLKELTISCERFQRFPKSIGYLKHLKKVSVIAGKMRKLPEEFCLLLSLEHLELIYCRMLSSLPCRFGSLTRLRHVDLHGSYKLNVLPASFKQLALLQHLNLAWCSKLTLNSDVLENTTKLEYLDLSFCRKVEELPSHITNQASLKELHIRDTGLTCLPKSFMHLINLQFLIIADSPISEFDFGRGPFTSSLSNLKKIHLSNTRVSKISISEDCCPCLLTLQLFDNQHLREIETLPITVRDIELVDCKMLKTVMGIGGVVNLQTLKISFSPELDLLPSFAELIFLKEFELKGCNKVEKIEGLQYCRLVEKVLITDCPELNGFPSFAELTCLKEFELKGRNKVERIEGLQHCSSLEELLVSYSCWELPGIESLQQMQKLKTLQLVAKKVSAVGPCIQTIQKWPEELIISTEAVPDAELILNQLAFPNLCVVDSIAKKKIFYPYPTLRQEHSSNADAIMLCLVIKCVSTFKKLIIQGDNFYRISSAEVDEGKWILIGVFTQHSSWHTADNYYVRGWPEEDCEDNEVEKGFLVMGEEARLVEALYRLLPVIAN